MTFRIQIQIGCVPRKHKEIDSTVDNCDPCGEIQSGIRVHEYPSYCSGIKFVFLLLKKIQTNFLYVGNACMYMRAIFHTQIQKNVA
jgi:hypothetical protein